MWPCACVRLSPLAPRLCCADLPNARSITIRMMLTHTSGLPDYEDFMAHDSPRWEWTRAELLAPLTRPKFAPGARYGTIPLHW